MESTFLTAVHIRKVRHLNDIDVALSPDKRKHLIFTGKNGSGKTSVLNALVAHLEFVVSNKFQTEKECIAAVHRNQEKLNKLGDSDAEISNKRMYRSFLATSEEKLIHWTSGAVTECTSFSTLREKYESGRFILASYGDTRNIAVNISKNIEKVDLKPVYTIGDNPSRDLVKYMVNMKATQAFTNDEARKQEINAWFGRFENILQKIYDDTSLKLNFDAETFQFTIHVDGREPFDFNTMSMGYAAVFDIIGDLMMRMERQAARHYDLEGIVLIDEIDAHLHVELQRKIVPVLTELFPNLQFILTTHSPFILSSAQNVVIYDLEIKKCVQDGLTNLPYEGIVEGYFGADRLSQELRRKFERYKKLAQKADLSDADYAEIAELEQYLNEIPDYLAFGVTTEYERLKLELDNRGQVDG